MIKIPDVMAYLEEMGTTVGKHIEQLTKKQNETGKELTKPFEGISNKIQILLKITPQICNTSFKTKAKVNLGEVQKQVLKTLYRDLLFVATMSTVEYYFLQILLQYPNYKTTEKIQSEGVRNVKISKLIKWARDEKILLDYDLWDFVISARNDIVHYNAIAREPKESPITDFPINMVKGQELSGELRSLLSLTRSIEESFYNIVFCLQ